MMRLGVWGSMLLASIGLCGCVEDEVEQRTTLRSCDGNRESTLHVMRDLDGATRAHALGNDGYLLFGGSSFDAGLRRLDANGELLEQIPNPSDMVPWITDVASFDDGSVILSGVVQDFTSEGGSQGWVGRLDASGSRAWELDVALERAQHLVLRALPDGGAIVAGFGSVTTSTLPDGEDAAVSDDAEAGNGLVSWMRISPTGEVVWQNGVEIYGPLTFTNQWYGAKLLTLGPEQTVKLVVQTRAGYVLITSDWDGESPQQTVLETRLAGGLIQSEALPDGRLAILSLRGGGVLTLVDPDGLVLSEHSYGRLQNAQPRALVLDAGREELIMGGSFRGDDEGQQRTWMVGVDLQGMQRWSITRDPIDLHYPDGNIDHVAPGQGPDVTDLAISPNGRMLAPGSSSFELSYFIVDPEGCHD